MTPPPIRPLLAASLIPALLLVPVLSSAFAGLGHPVVCRADAEGATTVTRPRPMPNSASLSRTPTSRPPGTGMVHLGDDGPSVITRDAPPAGDTTVAPRLDDDAGVSAIANPPVATRRCDGFNLAMRVTLRPNGKVTIVLPVRNSSTRAANATVDLRVGTRRFPVRVGRVASGATRTTTLHVAVPHGDSPVAATLLLGP